MQKMKFKKNNLVFVAICAFILVLSVVLAVSYIGSKNSADLPVQTSAQIKKAKTLKNAVRLCEGIDFSLSGGSAESAESSQDVIRYLKDSDFDSVFLKTKLLTSKSKKKPEKELKKIFAFSKELSKLKKEVVFEIDFSAENGVFKKAFENKYVSGVVLTGTEKATAKKLNKKLSALLKLSGKKQLAVSLPGGYTDLDAVKGEKLSFVLLNLDGKNVAENKKILSAFEKAFEKKSVSLCIGLCFEECTRKKASADLPLQTALACDESSLVSLRLFSNLSDIRTDTQNCFSAVSEYIKNGIDEEKAFKTLSVEDYEEGETAKSTDYRTKITVHGSPLFPVIFDGEEVDLSDDGTAELELSLKTGENKFTVSQCGKMLKYKVRVDFEGEVIREISPISAVYASPGKKVKIIVRAAAGARVTVKAGAARYEATPVTKEEDGCCNYRARFTVPKSKVEIDSIGRLTVIASYKGENYSKEGPVVVYAQSLSNETAAAPDKSVTIQNNLSSPSTNGATTVIHNTADPASHTEPQQYTGGQMCIVTSAFADTWPTLTEDDSFVPYYTPLVRGTVDYVTGQSSIYDSEEETTRNFFDLASGRRVQTKDVMLIPQTNKGANKMSVVSSQLSAGDLTVKLSTTWEVPYSFSFGPQEYYTAYGKKFNVSDFTANYIQFTFYYTTAAGGMVNTSGSEVFSSASWSVDSSNKTATLTLWLKKSGGYYGYHIERNSSGQLVLRFSGRPLTLSGTRIVLDPGHGGSDGGAKGLSGAVNEAQLNFALAVAIKNELERRGATVYLTRTGDNDITLEERKTFARVNDADIFISVHCNASVNTSKKGTTVYYFRPFSEPLSNAIYQRMKSLFENDFYAGTSLAQYIGIGSIFNPFSVTRLEECPSVLIETGFITNEEECRLLLEASNREKIAAAVAGGVEEYIAR